MTVSSTSPRVKYNCNGSTTDFAFTFNCSASDELTVILTTSAGVETTLTENSHYFVTATNNDYTAGGTVSTCVTGDITTPYAWASGYTLTIMRVVDITQETDLVPQPTLYQTLENALDKCTRIDQQLQEQIDRTPKLKKSSATTGITFPEPDANKVIGWNAGATDLTTFTASATNINLTTIYQIADYSDDLDAAITAIGASEATLLINETADVNDDVTVPSNVHLWVVRPGVFSIDSGKTLTIYSPSNIIAQPNQQIFTGSGTVAFTYPGVVFPDWWGAIPDGSTACATAFQAASNSLPTATNFTSSAIGGAIFMNGGRYKLSTGITLKRGQILKGVSREATHILSFIASDVIKYTDTGNSIADHINCRDFSILQDASVTATSGAGIAIGGHATTPNGVNLILDNITIKGTYDGVYGTELMTANISNVDISSTVNHGFHVYGAASSNASTAINFLNSYAHSCGADGFHIDQARYSSIVSCASDSNTGCGYYVANSIAVNLQSASAEQNTSYNYHFTEDGNVFAHIRGIAKASSSIDNIYISGTYGVYGNLTLMGELECGSGNTGYAINQAKVAGQIVCNGLYITSSYTIDKISNSRINLLFLGHPGTRTSIAGGPGINLSIGTGDPESYIYGDPGSFYFVPNAANNASLFAKQFGVDTAYGWKNLRGCRFASAVPAAASGAYDTYTLNDIVWNSEPAATEWIGWVCVTSGTFGTLSGVTGSIDTGTTALTVNSATNLHVGHYITIAGVTGAKRITVISGTSVTVDSASDATVAGAAVAYQAPAFKGFGVIES